MRTINIGSNRGKARLWLEGKWIADECKFTAGQRVTTEYHGDGMTIRPTRKDEAGDHKLAERRGKLILDYSGKSCPFAEGSTVEITTKRNRIIVRAT